MLLIGISGVARSGKDTFADLLTAKINKAFPRKYCLFRRSLAFPLRKELENWCSDEYGLDVHTQNEKEKELIRPLLVAHGKIKRQISDGNYWIDLLEKNLPLDPFSRSICFVTDVRYDEYSNDEAWFIQEKHKGILVHIERTKSGHLILPKNEEERLNDPKLRKRADFKISWPTSRAEDFGDLIQYVDDFFSFLITKEPNFFTHEN